MAAGRPPKPVEQKRRAGNPGKRSLTKGSLATVPDVVSDPDVATVESPKAALESILEAGSVWLARTDAPKLALLRETLEERELVRNLVMQGAIQMRPDLRKLDTQVQSLLSECGFDPAARSRLGLAEVKAVSTLDKLRRANGK